MRQHRIPVLAVNHAKQVIRPVRQHAWSAITQGYKFETTDTMPQVGHLAVVDIEHQHGIGTVTQFVMPHDHTKAFYRTLFLQALQTSDHGLFLQT